MIRSRISLCKPIETEESCVASSSLAALVTQTWPLSHLVMRRASLCTCGGTSHRQRAAVHAILRSQVLRPSTRQKQPTSTEHIRKLPNKLRHQVLTRTICRGKGRAHTRDREIDSQTLARHLLHDRNAALLAEQASESCPAKPEVPAHSCSHPQAPRKRPTLILVRGPEVATPELLIGRQGSRIHNLSRPACRLG
jgi:hypothetical protein